MYLCQVGTQTSVRINQVLLCPLTLYTRKTPRGVINLHALMATAKRYHCPGLGE